ncbi:MAG: GNAT family N-acetyltransferase [Symbiobacteriaceae bacterium]|nr:GNAT family N-acetyltransferase [Symbiobacteriaceae bacterium]
METRLLTANELPQAIELWRYCFGDPTEFINWYFRERAHQVLAVMQGKQLVAQMVCVAVDISWWGVHTPAVILSGVATAPSFRRQGHMNTIMHAGTQFLQEQGIKLALLYPFNYHFYESYGFVACGEVAKIRVGLDQLPSLKPRGEFLTNLNPWEAAPFMLEAYELAFAGYNGRVQRTVETFHQRQNEYALEDGHTVVYLRQGRCEGYMLYRFNAKDILVMEIAAGSQAAREDLLSFLSSHASTATTIELLTPLEDPLRELLAEYRSAVSLEPYDMFRILDLPGVVAGIPGGEGELRFHIEDRYAPWHQGNWCLRRDQGRLLLQQEGTSAASLPALNIRQLTRWLAGCISGTELQQRGIPLPNHFVETMDCLVPKRPFFVYEMY